MNIKEVKDFKTHFNFSQEVVFTSPGVIVGEYFTSELCKGETNELENFTKITKVIEGEKCTLKPLIF